MIKFTMTHEINCDVDTFWKMFFDKEFNDALYKTALGFTKYDVVELACDPWGWRSEIEDWAKRHGERRT